MQLHLPCLQHRNHSEHDSSCHRDQQSDPNNNPVHVDRARLPQSSRQAGSGDASQHECQEDSRNAACQRKEHTLHKKLKSHAPSRGTQARRSATPRCRVVARDKSKLATLMQAIRSSSADAISKTTSTDCT